MKKRMRYVRQEVPGGTLRLANQRIDGLLERHLVRFSTLRELLSSAYLQGITDAAQALGQLTENEDAEKKS